MRSPVVDGEMMQSMRDYFLVDLSALIVLQCFDAIDRVTETASGPKDLCQKFPKDLFQN